MPGMLPPVPAPLTDSPAQVSLTSQNNVTKKNPAFFQAIQANNIGAVKYFVEVAKLGVNSVDEHGIPALVHAVMAGRRNIVIYLQGLPEKPVFDPNNFFGYSERYSSLMKAQISKNQALTGAIWGDNIDAVKDLIESEKVDVNSVDEDGISVLAHAVTANNRNIVIYLLGLKPDLDAQSFSGYSALMRAVISNYSDMAELLLEAGANPDLYVNNDYDKDTALMMAADTNRLDMVKLLLKHKVNVELKDDSGCTAQTRAARKGYSDIAETLGDARDPIIVFIEAIWGDNIDAVKDLIEGKKVDVNSVDEEGISGLAHAAMANSRNIVIYLLGLKPDLDAQSKFGYSALMRAVISNNPDLARRLLEAGANPNLALYDNKDTALMMAADANNLPMVEILLEHNANVDLKDDSEYTAQTRAARKGYFDIAKAFTTPKAPSPTAVLGTAPNN